MINVFVAHAKADGDEFIELAQDEIATELAKYGPVTVTLGRDDHAKHFARCGGWDAWAIDVASGVDQITREPRYHSFVALDRRVGRATAGILDVALKMHKPVFVWEEGRLLPIRAVVEIDVRNMRSGWELRP